MLPFATDQTEVSLLKLQCRFHRAVGLEIASKQEIEMPRDSGFWDKFLDPSISAFDMLARGVKRHAEALQPENKEDPVDKRVMARQTLEVSGFLQYIKDVPERTWHEEREATWEMAIRRWILLIEQWEAKDVPLLEALHSKTSFVERAQILVMFSTTRHLRRC